MFGRDTAPPRHRTNALLLGDETAGRLGADGRALLGTFDEAELDAVGIRGSIGAPDLEATASPLDRADPAAREAAVAAALAGLVAAGVVEAARPGTPPRRLVVHGPLGLLRDALTTYPAVLLVMASGVAHGDDAVMRVGLAVQVVDRRDRPLLLDQRLDTVTGRTDVVLWAPQSYAAALAREAFTDPAGERPDGLSAGGSGFALRAAWKTTRSSRPTVLVLKLTRREGEDTALLRTTVDDEEMPPATGGCAQVEQVLVNLFHRVLLT